MSENNDLQEILDRLRKNTDGVPSRNVREGHHVKIGGKEDPLKKNFKSSGTKNRESDEDCVHTWVLEDCGDQCDWVCKDCGERDRADIILDEDREKTINLGTVRWLHQKVMQARSEMDRSNGGEEKLEKVQETLYRIIQNRK